MKTLVMLGWLMVSTISFAQGTTQSSVSLDGTHAIPSHDLFRQGNGTFSLSQGSMLDGFVGVNWGGSSVTSVTIFRSSSVSDLGSSRAQMNFVISVAPFEQGNIVQPGRDVFGISQAISVSDVQELVSGEWWVNVATVDFPNGELRGQIVAVPEPSMGFLIGISGLALVLSIKRGLWKRATYKSRLHIR